MQRSFDQTHCQILFELLPSAPEQISSWINKKETVFQTEVINSKTTFIVKYLSMEFGF